METTGSPTKVFHAFSDYLHEVEQLVERHATSGPQQTEALVEFTKLNFSRMKRIYKTYRPADEIVEKLIKRGKCRWTIITEAWCGDAAQTVPVLARLAEINPSCALNIVYRDENPELIDRFLTNGSRSIPILIVEDANGHVQNHWGPRPAALQNKFMEGKKAGIPKAELQLMSQEWYNLDKGKSTAAEIALNLK